MVAGGADRRVDAAGHVDEKDYVERRAVLDGQAHGLRRTLADPRGELDAWRHAVREVLTTGVDLVSTYRASSQDDKRALLVKMYANLPVSDRVTKPVLRIPFTLLDEPRPDSTVLSGKDANAYRPSETLLNERKNARRISSSERAFHAWWTLTGSNR